MSNNRTVGPVMETVGSATPSSDASSSNLLPTSTEKSPVPSSETLPAAAKLRKEFFWVVDNSNWQAALLAMPDKQVRAVSSANNSIGTVVRNYHPFSLRVVARVNESETLPVDEVFKAANRDGYLDSAYAAYKQEWKDDEDWHDPRLRCFLESFDTFYTATDVAIDKERLKHITAYSSIRLETFLGHLDHATIVKLPRFRQLGLAIGSAVDVAAISALSPPHIPDTLHVSVTARVAVGELRVLPVVRTYHLYLPFLSDDRVNCVKPAIEALLPKLKMWFFSLPNCLLTSYGFDRMIEQLRAVKIPQRVNIEMSGTWQPSKREKKRLAIALHHAVGCGQVNWGDDRIIYPCDYLPC